jgi:glycerol uptake facilitator-like aquaporin
VGHVSGGHFNSAVTIGLWAGGRFKAADVISATRLFTTVRSSSKSL